MKCFSGPALAVASALSIGGCSMNMSSPVASAPPVPAGPPPVVYGAFLDGPVGEKLGGDKDRALAAQQDALASGQRRTWKGAGGVFGFVEPAAPAVPADGGETCRGFTSTVYIGGRPQVGHGRGCQGPDGTYRVVG